MRQRVRENALCVSVAGACCAMLARLGLYGFAWNDYETEAKPAFDALVGGHVLAFLRLAPAYGGSLVERAPFALIPGLWDGGQLAIYRAVALPCLLATAVVGVWLAARMRAAGSAMFACVLAVVICTANPLALSALELGHPEELLGAGLCVAAVLLAARRAGLGPVLWAGGLLGLAIANKEWALVAVGPVLLALPARTPGARSWRGILCLMGAFVVAMLVLTPLLLASSGRFAASTSAATTSPAGPFQPWQLWWFFGSHGRLLHGMFGIALPGYRVGPTWTSTISHPLIVAFGGLLALGLWLARKRSGDVVGERDALLLLALVLLLRCVLDTWDTGYYMLPCLLALLAWEITGSHPRPPLLTLALVVLPWFGLQELSAHGASPDAQAALFLAWTLPLAGWLGLRLFSPRRSAALSRPEAHVGARPHEAAVA